jgi:uncharacterized membrane protein
LFIILVSFVTDEIDERVDKQMTIKHSVSNLVPDQIKELDEEDKEL